MNIDVLAGLLGRSRYRTSSESVLQAGLALVLQQEGVAFEREAALSPEDRVDFLVDGIAVEVKTQGSTTEVLRQLHRYAQHDGVSAVLLVTTRMRHRAMPDALNGKPVRVLHLLGSVL